MTDPLTYFSGDITEFHKIRALKRVSENDLAEVIRKIVAHGVEFRRLVACSDELLSFADTIRDTVRQLSTLSDSFEGLGAGAKDQIVKHSIQAIDEDGEEFDVPQAVGEAEVARETLLELLPKIEMAAGAFSSRAGYVKPPKKRPTLGLAGVVAAACEWWEEIVGQPVASAKGLEYTSGKTPKREKIAVRPQNDDAYFVFLCAREVDPSCTPSNVITAINTYRIAARKVEKIRRRLPEMEDRRKDLNSLAELIWPYLAGISVKRENSSD